MSVLSCENRSKLIPNSLNFPENFQFRFTPGKIFSCECTFEPIHTASVLSRFALSPAHS